jgi:HD-GYP domain-containing protein (c-di-GMP phosphodiesterase class II)
VSRRFGLVGTFALWGFVTTAVFVVGITLFAIAQVERITVDTFARAVSGTVNGAIVNSLGNTSVEDLGVTPSVTLRLDAAVRTGLLGKQIQAVKVWAPDGTILYSTAGEKGQSFPTYEPVKRAMAGETFWFTEAAADEDEESAAETKQMGDIIEIYAPLRESATGPIVGAIEVYAPYAPIREQVPAQLAQVWGLSIVAGLALYGVLLAVVKRTSDTLRATQEQADKLNVRLEMSLAELEQHSVGTLQALVAAVDAKDSYTARHSLGVTDYAVAAGRRLDLPGGDLIALERASLLHDIGKIGVPEAVLLKPRELTREEFELIKAHPGIGAQIIDSIPFLELLVPIVRHHHERWDGGGYPYGLSGENIPLMARIVAVADAYEAMTSDRPYRRALRAQDARAELVRNVGKQFDAVVVNALIDALDAGEVRVSSRGTQH